MFKFKRPEKPPAFDADSQAATDKVRDQIAQGKKPEFNDGFWGKYKSYFFTAQHHRCGYCEAFVTEYGDMEHYRPKSVIEDIESDGRERENLHTVAGRKFKKACERGYWWLAYSWENYLLSCSLCNRPWKRAVFPVKDDRKPNSKPDSDHPYDNPDEQDDEIALLLNPFDEDMNPSDHLEFTEIGLIKPRNNSEYGKATIRTCGLDRDSLNTFRLGIATQAYLLIKNFATATRGSSEEKFLATLLLKAGDEKAPCPGVYRIVFEHMTDGQYQWDDLVQFV